MNSSFDAGGQFAWDGTSLDTLEACPRKYYYRHVMNAVPAGTSVHLLFGSLYATALETFYSLRARGDSIEAALHAVVKLALRQSWGQTFDHPAKTRMNLIRTIIWYVDEFAEESEDGLRTYHLADGSAAVELSFTLEFSPDFLYCGHLDRVVQYGDALYWMDQKTTGGAITPRFFADFKPRTQFLGYTWAGQSILHSPVKGGVIDAAQIAVGFSNFARDFITFTQSQIEEWKESALYWMHAGRDFFQRGFFPMNLASCGNYGGCPYRTLCARSPSIRENYLQSEYKTIAPWDPLKAR